jgi:hypothetical protein
MSEELSETYKAMREHSKQKRARNGEQSLELLRKENIPHEVCNLQNLHILVCGRIDFWPTTGRWIVRCGKEGWLGRGVMSLIKYVRSMEAK